MKEMENIVEDKLFICECHTEALNIAYFRDDVNEEFDFTMFKCYTHNIGLWERIKAAFKILTKDRTNFDEICFGRKTAEEIIEFMSSKLLKDEND